MQFSELELCSALQTAIAEAGYTEPTPIQAQAIPAILSGRDVMAAAQTGTGKTAGFSLPLLESLRDGPSARSRRPKALVLVPTRELASQVGDCIGQYRGGLPLRHTVIFGGVGLRPQIERLERGVDVLVATPGRLLDLAGQGAVKFDDLRILVLDEADRMLDMGFIHDIRRLLRQLPPVRQNLMFSATFSPSIRELARGLMVSPLEISVAPPNSTSRLVEQWVVPVDKENKTDALIHLIKDGEWSQVLVFTRTKHGANKLTRKLEAAGVSAAAIHGNKSQNARVKALADFKAGKVSTLVATDIAARGLDIHELPQVVNFDLPNVSEDYVHRIGRTGRAGAAGCAVSLVTHDEYDLLRGIERLTKKTLERRVIAEFAPKLPLPVAAKPAAKRRPRRRGGTQ